MSAEDLKGSGTETQTDTGKRLSPAEWAEMTARYEAGTVSIQDLSNEFGVSKSAISQKFRRDNVVKGSKAPQISAAVTQKAVENAVSSEEERQKRIDETKKQSYQSATMIHVMTHKLLVDTAKNSHPMDSIAGDLKALKAAAEIFQKTKDQRYHILGIDEAMGDEEEPEILISDLSEEEIETLKGQEEEDDGELAELDDMELDDEE
ncbi:MAG: hypothetical protein JJ979_19480 [Roseibium sp.]|nr:hypothetical protein [Roseibium sp.]